MRKKTSILDRKQEREYSGLSPNMISGLLLCKDYNNKKIGLELGYDYRTVWDIVNRRRKIARIRIRITQILMNVSLGPVKEDLKEAYKRIWGEESYFWFLEHL
jgi:hypothetical protein